MSLKNIIENIYVDFLDCGCNRIIFDEGCVITYMTTDSIDAMLRAGYQLNSLLLQTRYFKYFIGSKEMEHRDGQSNPL